MGKRCSVRAISPTSQRASTPPLGGKPGRAGAGTVEGAPSGGAIGLRQVDEMALRLPAWWAQHLWRDLP